MHTVNFSLDVPESSDACARAAATGHHGAAPTGPRGATPEPPPPPLAPPPPMSIEQLLATKNELMHHGVRQPHHQLEMDSSYTDSQATHPPMFAEASIPLEADN
jgi:hypothetical protein